MFAQAAKKCAVVGSGIMGLRAAVEMARKGYRPIIFTDQKPSETTTVVAGAIWMPYKAFPEDKVLKWAKASLDFYREMEKVPASGVAWRTHTEFFPTSTQKPNWMKLLAEGEPLQCQLPKNYASYYSVKLPLIDTRQLVTYHSELLSQLQIKTVSQKIHDLCSDLKDFPLIINASGAGARFLASDTSTYPIKGQLFTVSQPSQRIEQSVFYDTGDLATLVVPHKDHVAIGVTYKQYDASTNYEPEEEARLFQSACAFYPQLADSTVLSRRVGHRPGRTEGIRLEVAHHKGQAIIHTYGHAGGGITLAPGCAKEIVDLVETLVPA